MPPCLLLSVSVCASTIDAYEGWLPETEATSIVVQSADIDKDGDLNAHVTDGSSILIDPDAPEFDSTPEPGSTLDFGSISTVGTSEPQIINITNLGTNLLTLGCEPSGAAIGHFIIDVCPSPVAGGGSTQIEVRCQPTTQLLKIAYLDIVTNDPDTLRVNYTLRCTGVNYAQFSSTPAPDTSLDFGLVDVNTSQQLAIEVSNSGLVGLTLDCSLSGSNSGQFQIDACPPYVYTGSPKDIKVSCKPTAAGELSANLAVVTNDPEAANVSWPLNCNQPVQDVETIFTDGFEGPGI